VLVSCSNPQPASGSPAGSTHSLPVQLDGGWHPCRYCTRAARPGHRDIIPAHLCVRRCSSGDMHVADTARQPRHNCGQARPSSRQRAPAVRLRTQRSSRSRHSCSPSSRRVLSALLLLHAARCRSMVEERLRSLWQPAWRLGSAPGAFGGPDGCWAPCRPVGRQPLGAAMGPLSAPLPTLCVHLLSADPLVVLSTRTKSRAVVPCEWCRATPLRRIAP